MSRHNRLLAAVVQPGDTAEQLVARLTVEAFGWQMGDVVAFRKLRTDARVSVARTFLASRATQNPVELAMQETAAAYAEELRAHVALARAWRKGGPAKAQQAAYGKAKGAHAAAVLQLRAALDREP